VHELSLAEAIQDSVLRRAAGRTVERVDVRIGHFRQVVPDSLQFAWQMLSAGTELEGCALEIEHVPAVVSCPACGAHTTLDLPVFACGACGDQAVELISGEELLIVSLHIGQEVS
jgi:hydrogenase nickel incorporation protein HypA/HybF